MLGRLLDGWPDDALRRVLDAPVEEWRLTWDGCLACHRYDGKGAETLRAMGGASFDPALISTHRDAGALALWKLCGHGANYHPVFGGTGRYVRLCRRFTIPRTARAIKIRAQAILEQRHPLAKIAVLRAEVG